MVPGNPGTDQGLSTVLRSTGGQRHRFWPSRETINDGEGVCMALRRRKGSHEIRMEVRKSFGCQKLGLQRGLDMTGYLGSLTVSTIMSHIPDSGRSVVPDKVLHHGFECGFRSWMVEVVYDFEDFPAL